MSKQTLTFEHILYLLVFSLAFAIRGTGISHPPLSDYEADHAMRAVQVARGEPAELGTQPGYVLLTGLSFFLMGSSEAVARFWPVLAGTSLVLLPFLLREKLGRKTAFVIALGLALDPGLIALSQLAGGPVMAVSFVLLAGTAWLHGWTIAAGILAGLALLSGPAVVAGAVGLAVTVGLARILGLVNPKQAEMAAEEAVVMDIKTSPLRTGLLAAGGTLLLAGTLFLRYPQGLSAFAAALPTYLEGWSTPAGVSIGRLFITLISYPLPAVLFGLLAIVRAWAGQDEHAPLSRALSLWLVVSLIFSFAYPGRQVGDLAWALVPLWGLAGLELSRYLQTRPGDDVPWVLAGLVGVMLFSVWINLAGLVASNAQGSLLALRWLVIVGAILLAILSAVLVGLGWSRDTAQRGLVWGTAISLGLGMLASIWGATERQLAASDDIWKPVPGAGDQLLLQQTLGDLSVWNTGRVDSLAVISLVDAPSLRWALRNMPNVRFQSNLSRDEMPEALITRQEQAELSLGSAYRGQDFVWWVYPNWDGWAGLEWVKWFVFHEGTVTTQGIIVWARGDLFPSGEEVPAESLVPEIDVTGEQVLFVPDKEIFDRDAPLK